MEEIARSEGSEVSMGWACSRRKREQVTSCKLATDGISH